ncbi:unnamed protein product [Rhodiola kirilowii]
MSQPPGFIDKTYPDHVCMLQKIYLWIKTITKAMEH